MNNIEETTKLSVQEKLSELKHDIDRLNRICNLIEKFLNEGVKDNAEEYQKSINDLVDSMEILKL